MNAEHKRQSRARKPSAWHDRERELSRQRMALTRARKRAQKRASLLRSLQDEVAKKTFEARADKERQRLINAWFRRKGLKLDPESVNDNDILISYMQKFDLQNIELQVAEFEISMMTTGVGDDSVDGESFASEQEKVKANNHTRMAIGRARKKAQNRASQLKSRLDKWDKQVLEARADKEKQRLICDWFRRKGWRMDLESINDDVVKNLMPKFDLRKIETQVAEFEISIMGVGGDNDEEKNLASGPDKSRVGDDNVKGENQASGQEKGKAYNRKRMAIARARNRAQSRASQLRSRLDEEEKQVFEARANKEKKRLICDWFSHKGWRNDPKSITDHAVKDLIPKLDFQKIETQVAEFEISIIGVGGDNDDGKSNLASGTDKEKEITTSEMGTVLKTASVPETGTPSTAAGDSGKDEAAASLLLGLRGAKRSETAAIGIASVREAPPAAVGHPDEGASRPDPVAATGNAAAGHAAPREAPPAAVGDSDEGVSRPDPVVSTGKDDGRTTAIAAGHAASPSLDAGTAPVAFPLWEGWRSAIDRGSGRVYVYRQLPGRRAPSNLGVGVLPPRRGAETSGDIGTCEANDASIPDSQMSSHA